MGFEDGEVNAMVFLGCMLTIISCSATILYFRTSCFPDPIAFREMLKTRRGAANRYERPYAEPLTVSKERYRNIMDVIRVKRITTQYEILPKEQDDEKSLDFNIAD